MSQQLYMFITDSPEQYWIESYTKYITTVEGFADMLVSEDFLNDTALLDVHFQEIKSFLLTEPDTKGNITVRITGIDWFDEIETVERGLIPVTTFM